MAVSLPQGMSSHFIVSSETKQWQKDIIAGQVWRVRCSSSSSSSKVRQFPTAVMETFKTAAVDATKLKQRPNNKYLSDLYGLYKQATVGDNTSDRPGMFDIAGRAKWDAWILKKGLSKEEAMEAYVNLVKELKGIYGMD